MRLQSRKPSEAPPARLGALARLPIFLDLQGKRAVLAGGSAAAAWKAELLAAAGADVEIYATHLEPEMASLLQRGCAAGRLSHHPRPWAIDSFDNAAIAVADAPTDAEAKAFACAARTAGVAVNVIDKPAQCQFQFGSIVNRSPVVIGISTDGAAPILGQAIRRRIETLLPASLATWAAFARDIRQDVMRRLVPGPQRRAFWERFTDRALSSAEPDADMRGHLTQTIDKIARAKGSTAGRVTLVGAGPGDPELLTLKAVRALQAADVILFDDLVSDDVLELARREAKRMMVGKRGGRESCRQDDINALMLKLARQGKNVVRLKAGDPMVFGRAGEEIAHLESKGIAVSVVPGISAGIALASELGASLTHREHAHSVRFVTGHSRAGDLPADLDWEGLADPQTTLVFYMGGRTAPRIAARLIAQGLPETTPTVVAKGVSRKESERICGTLGSLAADGPVVSGTPVLIGIGPVFATRQATAQMIRNQCLSA